ncbi:hypothetical protein [uncultured Chitinophaga sp.]|uniref:hypothetical protein n=1 Tax=uncultured Chitinophaga sp. TaxID=339340 RepID=UPI002614A202|nr:hypothetical protein [uncultured Chitinophaga sp.]
MIFGFSLFKKKKYPGKSLVIIDRDKAALDKIKKICEEHEIKCFTAYDPTAGLKLVTSHKPYAAVLSADYATDLTRLRKAHKEYENLLVIILAEEKWANSRQALVDALIKTGAQEFVAKPVSATNLMTVVQRLFENKAITSK